jgi:hypothetical protein
MAIYRPVLDCAGGYLIVPDGSYEVVVGSSGGAFTTAVTEILFAGNLLFGKGLPEGARLRLWFPTGQLRGHHARRRRRSQHRSVSGPVVRYRRIVLMVSTIRGNQTGILMAPPEPGQTIWMHCKSALR